MRPRLPAVLALLALLLVPAAAHAHGVLRRSEPAAGARLTEVPRQLRLTFNEPLVPAFTRVTLRAASGDLVALAPLRIEGDTIVVADVTGALAPGAWTIAWQVAGADGHPVRGEVKFTIAAGAAGLDQPGDSIGGEAGALVPAPAQPGPPAAHHHPATTSETAFGAESPAFVAVRSLLYFALLVVIGAVAFRQVVLRRGLADPAHRTLHDTAELRAAAIGVWAARATVVIALLRLLAQSYAMHGADLLDATLLTTMVTQTLWGWGWVAQVVAALVAERAFHGAHRAGASGGATGGAWSLATAAAVVLAVTPSLASHAAAAPRLVPLALLADSLHVLAAGAWMGGLLLVLLAGVSSILVADRARLGPLGSLVRAFSPVALTAAAVLVITGVFAAWLHVGTVGGIVATTYGRVLLLKLGILAAVGALGFVNWRFVLPLLESHTGVRRFTRSGAAEVGVGALVVLVTAVLVALPTG